MNLGQAAHLSGQAVQMNPGSGGRLSQHQRLQVASGHHGVDPEFETMRRTMCQNIKEFMEEKKMVSENRVLDLAWRFEEVMYRKHPNKADYYNILKEPIGRHLNDAVMTITAQGQQRQQMSRHITSSSSYGTMIPTPGMSQSASGNSRMPYVMDNTGGNSMTGSMSNGSQQRSTNVPLNSTTSNISSVTGSVSIQRQVTHMIPTPGFSNQQTLPANSECSNGAGYLNGESNAMPQMQQQQKSFGSNQSCCPVQHLGGHAGSGVHSGMLENSSSYGSSDAQLNGGMELCRSNIQIINKTAASESFTNLSPYGSSHNKHLQQQFSHPPLQRTPTSADMAASRSLYGTGSSALTASSNLDINPANLLSNSRMNSGLLKSQTTMQYIRPQPHIKAEALDPQVKVNFRKSQITHEQLLQQQHQLQPNHPHSQFMRNEYSFNLQQQNSQHHQVMCRGNSLEQCQLGSGHAEQLLDQGDLLHNELISSQATKHADLPNLQGHYQITSSHDNNERSQISGQFSGSQNFQIPVSHDSQQLLPPHQQSDDGSNGVSCFLKGTYTEPLFQPHCRSQPTEKAYVTNSLSTEKQVQDDYFQRTMAQDRAQQPVLTDQHVVGCAVTSLDLKSSKLPTRGSEQATRNIKNYRNQLRWLLMLIHAKACPAPIGSCKSQYCACVQDLVKHFKFCQRKNCSYMYCRESKKVFYHYKNCVDEHCPVCSLAKERLRRSSEQVHKHNPAEPIITSQQNTNQRITNGVHDDRMDIDLVAVETFDDQPSASKRLRLQPVFPNASENGISHVPVPQANPGFVLQEDHPRQLEQNNKMVPKQGVNVRVTTQPPQKHVIIGYGTDGKIGAMANNVIPGVLNEIDSHVKQESFSADKEMNENVLDIKNKTNGSTDVTMSKLGKPKIKGVSLMELFSPEQINEHINSLRQWVGQSKAKAEKNQAIGYSENENSCQLCKVEKLNFEPPPIYCSPCGARIKRNASYYTGSTTEARHHFCTLCYNESRSHTIEVEGIRFLKANLEKRRNDDEAEEGWVQCDKCECWQHQICALFNVRRNDGGEAEYTCHNCYVQEIKHGLRMPLPESALLGAKDLPRTVLSDHIEERLFKRLRDERQDRANLSQKSFDEVPGADGLVVRVVSSVDKKLEVKPHFFEFFREDNYPAEFPYKSKAILLFQKIEGVEVCLFGMYVQEFGAECAFPNQRRVYLSYLDSVKYFRPEIKTVSGEALRTYVYHEILIGYLDYCKRRGFTSCYIWACPPLKGEDYILYCHPEIQKTPKSDKLREWYLSMLQKAIKERIVVELTNLYDHFFTTKECKAEVSAARLPYFDGDYWPGAAEDMINQLRLEEDGGKLQKGKMKKTITKRASKAAGHTDLSGNASKDDALMQKLGKTICPMKEDFIMVHLQYSCSHCSILMVSGRRWVCDQCKRFYICDKCYDAEQRLEENERHPSNSRDSHILHPVEIVGVPEDTKDRDDILESEFFDTRQAFLSLCQGNHYQYDTLRRAKHSSMMVLYHLHNPTAPAFVTTCNVCNHDIETGQGWRCEECPDFDVCTVCYQKDGGASHRHKLTNGPSSADPNAQNKEARQKRVQQVRVMLELLVHVPLCHVPDCQYPNCRRVKGLFRHGHHCKIRASGGCEPCKKMWYLIRLHARVCKESNCSMPRCRDLKDHLRRLQQQSDSRRRAAVNEMMRQRTAEVAGIWINMTRKRKKKSYDLIVSYRQKGGYQKRSPTLWLFGLSDPFWTFGWLQKCSDHSERFRLSGLSDSFWTFG